MMKMWRCMKGSRSQSFGHQTGQSMSPVRKRSPSKTTGLGPKRTSTSWTMKTWKCTNAYRELNSVSLPYQWQSQSEGRSCKSKQNNHESMTQVQKASKSKTRSSLLKIHKDWKSLWMFRYKSKGLRVIAVIMLILKGANRRLIKSRLTSVYLTLTRTKRNFHSKIFKIAQNMKTPTKYCPRTVNINWYQ